MLKFYTWNVPGICLLVPARSGILYANQTGGHHCYEQSVEAVLLPLFNRFEDIDQERLLTDHFVSKYGGWCGDGIGADTADFVDQVLASTPYTSWLCVDQSRLNDSHEAWVFVKPNELRDTETIEFQGFKFEAAVVTWPNSD